MTDELWDRELDTTPWEDLQDWQRSHLPAFVSKLQERSVFYADKLGGIEPAHVVDQGAWAQIPFTTKDDLRSAQQQPVTEKLLGDLQCVDDADVAQVIASSGTTGTPMFFGLTEKDRTAWTESIANMFFTAGIRRDSVVGLTTGMPLVAGGLPYADAIRRTGATLVWVGGQSPARMVSITDRLKIDTLVGTASFATFFAERSEQILHRPAYDMSVRTIIAGGEPGLGQPAIRDRIQQDWGATRISEVMGLGDVMSGLWAECPEGYGMHFTAGRNVYVELIDPETGESIDWEPGVQGEAVYTTFTREATPALRYRSRDHLEIQATGACACGRTSPVVRCIGRTDDMLIYKAMNVFPSAIRDVVMADFSADISGPMRLRKEYADQVRFNGPIPLEIEISAERDQKQLVDLAHRIDERVRESLRVRVAVEFVEPGTIEIGQYKNALTYSPA